MFYNTRYQTGEVNDIIQEMKQGRIPCMDVVDYEELDWFIERLAGHSIYKVEGLPYDRNARNTLEEPEFEFRIAFSTSPHIKEPEKAELMYIDFYFDPDPEKTYDSIGEI